MNVVQFPIIIRHLCRIRTDLKCSYCSNVNTRGVGTVVVSVSDWHAGVPGLLRRRKVFGIKKQ